MRPNSKEGLARFEFDTLDNHPRPDAQRAISGTTGRKGPDRLGQGYLRVEVGHCRADAIMGTFDAGCGLVGPVPPKVLLVAIGSPLLS